MSLAHQNPSKTSEKMGYFDGVTVSLHTFYIPQTERLRARKIGLQYKIRHKKAFKFIFGDRNLRLRDRAFVHCALQQMMTEMT